MKENTQQRQARKARDAAKRAACAFADGIEPRLLRKPIHLTSGERAFIGRTWKEADAARANMSAEKKAVLDQIRAGFPTI